MSDNTSTQTQAARKIRVGIIGGGIGGLSFAVALNALSQHDNLEVDIYESTAVISEIGAGITLWPRVWKMVQAIDLEKSLLRFAPSAPDDTERLVFQLRKADQKKGVFIHDMVMRGGSTSFHRADLQQTLLERIKGRVHLKHRFTSYEEVDNEVRLQFADGSSATCDILVGFDGIKSALRKELLIHQNLPKSPAIDAVWSGTMAYRGILTRELVDEIFPNHRAISTPMMYLGKNKHVIVYTISRSLVNVAAFVTDLSKEGTPCENTPAGGEDIKEELLGLFTEWEEEVQVLLRALQNPMRWPINNVRHMDSYALGRVLIAGDAAHGMPPHQGAGASQAIEDGYILASLLSDTRATRETIPKIVEIYNTIRCPEGNRTLQASLDFGKLLELTFPGMENFKEGDDTMPRELLERLGQTASKDWEWIWKQTAEGDRRRALDMLRAAVPVVGSGSHSSSH